MTGIINKEKCCGCTACFNVCPKHSIVMVPDFEGFLYPEINQEQCTNCGLCEKVCPVLKPVLPPTNMQVAAYVVRIKEEKVLDSSTSGGFFTPLAEYVLKNNGVVYGAGFDNNFDVTHQLVDNLNQERLNNFRGSKYVQSYLGDCFSKIKSQLMEESLVCFSGSPCQVAGLKSYLGREYKNLITVDFICKGIPSSKLWRKYMDYQRAKYQSKIVSVTFRKKTYGYHSSTMEIVFANRKIYHGSGRVDYMLKSFYSEISSRPSCYNCSFKSLEHCSDFTIFDSWHANLLVNELKDDDRGYTNLLVQSQKGNEFFEKIKSEFEYYQVDTEKAVKLDGCMVRASAIPHPMRKEYYIGIEEDDLSKHVNRYLPITQLDYIVEKVKGTIYKMGIYGVVKKIKG